MAPKQQIDLIAGKMGWARRGADWYYSGPAVETDERRMTRGKNLTPAGAEAVRDRLVEDGFDCGLSVTRNGACMTLEAGASEQWALVADVSAPDERTATMEAAAQVWRDK